MRPLHSFVRDFCPKGNSPGTPLINMLCSIPFPEQNETDGYLEREIHTESHEYLNQHLLSF